MLLENGADPNATDKLESTPLHRASAKGNYRLIQLLLRQSASTNIQDSQGNTPLYVTLSICFVQQWGCWHKHLVLYGSSKLKISFLTYFTLAKKPHCDLPIIWLLWATWMCAVRFSQVNWPYSGWGVLSPPGKFGNGVNRTPRWKHTWCYDIFIFTDL